MARQAMVEEGEAVGVHDYDHRIDLSCLLVPSENKFAQIF